MQITSQTKEVTRKASIAARAEDEPENKKTKKESELGCGLSAVNLLTQWNKDASTAAVLVKQDHVELRLLINFRSHLSSHNTHSDV